MERTRWGTRSDPLLMHAKLFRLELLNVMADLERELETVLLNGSSATWVSTG